jgi:hypothetical protein
MPPVTLLPAGPILTKPVVTALEAWVRGQAIPLSGEQLSTAITALSVRLEPAPPQVVDEAITEIKKFLDAFGMKSANPQAVLLAYREVLGRMPPDLIRRVVQRLVTGWKWGSRIPLPADLTALVNEDWSRRTKLLHKAQEAHRILSRRPRDTSHLPKISQEEAQKVLDRFRSKSTIRPPSSKLRGSSRGPDPDDDQNFEADKARVDEMIKQIMGESNGEPSEQAELKPRVENTQEVRGEPMP